MNLPLPCFAAEATWGTRTVTPMRTLEWISSEYTPSGRGRPATRRLLLGQIVCSRPWTPHVQPTLLVPGNVEVQIGILVEESDIETWRNLIARAKQLNGDPLSFSYQEVLFKADCPLLGQNDIAPSVIQIEIGSPLYASPDA